MQSHTSGQTERDRIVVAYVAIRSTYSHAVGKMFEFFLIIQHIYRMKIVFHESKLPYIYSIYGFKMLMANYRIAQLTCRIRQNCYCMAIETVFDEFPPPDDLSNFGQKQVRRIYTSKRNIFQIVSRHPKYILVSRFQRSQYLKHELYF